MVYDFGKIDSFQLDILKEVSNIGAGNAATALSKMIRKKVNMGVPVVKILDFKDVGNVLGDEEEVVFGVVIQVTGSITGMLLLILRYEDSLRLLQLLTNKKYGTPDTLDELALSCIRETGNILAGAYMSALAGLGKMEVRCLYPDVTIDMAAAILSLPAVGFAQIGNSVLYIDSNFSSGEDNIKANIFLVPEVSSYESLLRVLGVKI